MNSPVRSGLLKSASATGGAALVALGLLLGLEAYGPGVAAAGRGGASESAVDFMAGAASGNRAARFEWAPGEADAAAGAEAAQSSRSPSGRAVCVKLCDGAFFPLSVADAQRSDAACAALCPGAPTQAFFLSAGSDQIDGAVARDGQPYTALPVAFRYRSTFDSTCSCAARGARDSALAVLDDPTLRKGDLIMTASGIRVLRAAHRPPYGADDFVGLAEAPLPRDERAALAAMEQASAGASGADMSGAATPSRQVKGAAVAAHAAVRVSGPATRGLAAVE